MKLCVTSVFHVSFLETLALFRRFRMARLSRTAFLAVAVVFHIVSNMENNITNSEL